MSTDIRIKRGSGTTPALADGELGYNKDTKPYYPEMRKDYVLP